MGDTREHQQRLARAQRTLLSNLWHPQKHRICLRRSKYMVVRMASRALHWSTVKEDKDSSVVWLDRWESGDLMNLAPPRKMGHIPGVAELGTKCSIGKALNRIRNEFPLDYDFHPVSFILPAERAKLREFDAAYRGLARSVRSKEKAGAAAAAAAGVPYIPPPLPQPVRVASPGPSQLSSSPGSSSSSSSHATTTPAYPLLAPPATGCWPAPGTQAQPLPGRDRLVYIVKPDGGARGQGIYLALTLDDIEEAGEGFTLEDGAAGGAGKQQQGGGDDDGNSDDDDGEVQASTTARRPVMVQAYLPRPLLMDGRKFDLRIYVLVTSVYPTLRVFVYKQGLVRFATVQYEAPSEANVAQRRMFLTNYAVNKPGDRPRSPKPWDEPEPETSPSSLSSSSSSSSATPHSLLGRGWKDGGASPGEFQGPNSASSGSSSSSSSAGAGLAAVGGGVSRRPPPAMVIVDPPPGDETDEGDDIDDSDEVILGKTGGKGGGGGRESPSTTLDSDGEWDGGPRVSSNMRGWEAPGDHHQSPLPPRDGKVEIVRAQAGCKWTLSALFQCLEAQGVDTEVLWERVKDCIFKTLLSVRASLASKYRAARPTLRKEPPPGFVVEREAAAQRVREAAKRVAFKASRAKSMELAQVRAAEKARLASEAAEAARVASEAAAAAAANAYEAPLPLPSLRVTREEYNNDIMRVLMGPGVGGGGGGVLARGGAFSGVGSAAASASLRGLSLTGKGLNQGGEFGGGGGGGVRGRALAREMQQQQQQGGGGGGEGGFGGGLDFTVTGRKMNLAGPTSAAAALAAAVSTTTSKRGGLGGGSLPPLPTTLLPTPVVTTAPFSGAPVGSALSLARSGQSRSSSQRSASLDSSDSARTSPANSVLLPPTSSTPTAASGGGGKPPMASSSAAPPKMGGGGASSSSAPSTTPSSRPPPPMNPADREAAAAAAALAAAAAAAGTTGLEEEDGEQGFRAFEFMGLDVILDMSHCSCVPELVGYDPQRVASFKGARGEKAKGCPANRCQPKPVLLEINQSCSMHTDSDLDRIVKGDALRDGLTMVAPDERWLLESFVGAIKELGGLAGAAAAAMGGEPMTPPPPPTAPAAAAAATAFPWSSLPTPPPCCDATLFSTVAGARAALEDPSKDPILTRKTCTATPLDTRASLNDFPDLHASVVKSSHRALEESSRLLSQWPRGYPTPNLDKGEKWDVEGAGAGGGGGTTTALLAASSAAATAAVTPSSSPFNLAAMVRSTDTIPWVPPPLQPLFAAHHAVWNEEFWFGLKHHEIFLAAATGSKALANALAGIGGGGGGEGEDTTSQPSTPVASSMRPSSPFLTSKPAGGTGSSGSSIGGSSSSGGGGASGDSSCNIPSLSTIPTLSPRAALVLLLRRLYESRHAGGFERVSPPAHPGLAARYKAIAEFVPPSLRETAAYARRRAEALALRASSDKALLKGGQGGTGR